MVTILLVAALVLLIFLCLVGPGSQLASSDRR